MNYESLVISSIIHKSLVNGENRINSVSSPSRITDLEVTGSSSLKESGVPTPIAPSGTITDNTPTYRWTRVSGATLYSYQLITGTSVVYTRKVSSGACSTTSCTATPATALPLKTYKWRVKACIGGTWKSYSPYKQFRVTTPPTNGFNSPFNGSAPGWSVVRGTWKFINNAYYQTDGVLNNMSSIVHVYNYPTLDYQVKMKRTGCIYCANNLAIRGTVKPLKSDSHWNKAYLFEYSNDKKFSVWKMSPSGYTSLKGWTSYDNINPDGWNTLRVTAKGGDFKFYINGGLAWSGSDATLTTGQVGIMAYRYNDPDVKPDKFLVDWATLSTKVTPSDGKQPVKTGHEITGWNDFTRSPEA